MRGSPLPLPKSVEREKDPELRLSFLGPRLPPGTSLTGGSASEAGAWARERPLEFGGNGQVSELDGSNLFWESPPSSGWNEHEESGFIDSTDLHRQQFGGMG